MNIFLNPSSGKSQPSLGQSGTSNMFIKGSTGNSTIPVPSNQYQATTQPQPSSSGTSNFFENIGNFVGQTAKQVTDFIPQIPEYAKAAINPKLTLPRVGGVANSIFQFGGGVAGSIQKGIASVTNTQVPERWDISKQTDALNKLLDERILEDYGVEGQKAYAVGNFIGAIVPYTIGSEAAAASIGSKLLVPTAEKFLPGAVKFIPVINNAIGFLGIGQIEHNSETGTTRVEQLKNDLIMLALFETGGLALKGISKGTSALISKTVNDVKGKPKIDFETVQPEVQAVKTAIKEDTGKSPELITVEQMTEGKPTLYRGAEGKVEAVQPDFKKVLTVESNQAELIKKLADEGNPQAKALYDSLPNKAKVDFTIADPIIREAYQGKYDAVRFKNNTPQLKAQGATYIDLTTGKSFAEQRATAEAYSIQSRKAKYQPQAEIKTINEKQLTNVKDIRDVKTSLNKIQAEYEQLLAEAEGRSVVAQEKRANLNTDDIAALKRIYNRSQKFQEGDIETIRNSSSGNLLNRVIENIQETHPNMSEQEAFEYALNLPTKAQEAVKKTPDMKLLTEKQKTLNKYLDILKSKQADLSIKEDDVLHKQWASILSIQEDAAKIIEVPRSQLPVGEGQERVSRLEARITESLDKTPQEVKDQLGSTYNQMNKKENIAKAVEYITKNPDDAMAILRGEKEAPPGILKNSIYVAMENAALDDIALARKLASLASTRAGQELSILTEISPNSPVKLMNEIVRVREKALETKLGKTINQATSETVKQIEKEVRETAANKSDWLKFVKEIAC